jgi:glycosyltransferase involved in cell wall biosynthesis
MVRLYGPTDGEGSFVQVTRGMERALRASDALAGVVSLSEDSPSGEVPGYDAPIALQCGHSTGLVATHRRGSHKQHWMLLAPNGERLPGGVVEYLTMASPERRRGLLDGGLLAPSAWAAGVLGRYFLDREIVVAPHGICPEIHQSDDARRDELREFYRDEGFFCLHMTSTASERKGTRLLMRAWRSLKRRGRLPEKAALVLVMNPQERNVADWWAETERLTIGEDLIIVPGLLLGPADVVARRYLSAHIVCQPSRGEGFGCIPLEARASGVPVVMTLGTGHSEHTRRGDPGVIEVVTGPDAPMDDFPGSSAPSLTAEAIAASIEVAYESWLEIDLAARRGADAVREKWAWEKSSHGAAVRLRQLGEELKT